MWYIGSRVYWLCNICNGKMATFTKMAWPMMQSGHTCIQVWEKMRKLTLWHIGYLFERADGLEVSSCKIANGITKSVLKVADRITLLSHLRRSSLRSVHCGYQSINYLANSRKTCSKTMVIWYSSLIGQYLWNDTGTKIMLLGKKLGLCAKSRGAMISSKQPSPWHEWIIIKWPIKICFLR
jgi:hypothetical protein